jgi:Protein of unknown function (DUF997)
LKNINLETQEDPVYKRCRREALVALALWIAAGFYSVTTCYLLGYPKKAEDLKLVWGMPNWVVWGILVPWVAFIFITAWYSLVFIRNDDLGEDLHLEDQDIQA